MRMPLGWNGRNTLGFHSISTGPTGSSTSLMATSVMWPLPVAAKLPYSVTWKRVASGCAFRYVCAAFCGPMVWLDDGPLPIRNISLNDFMPQS